MPRFPFSRALATLATLCLVLAAAAAPKWNTIQAPHCLIVSQLSEKETREWATQFEQFTAAVRGVLTIEERFLPPLTVVLFADSGKFAPYCPRNADGKKRDIAGFFTTQETWSVIGLADAFSSEETRHVVLHEATHWLVSATATKLPLWLNEGFAEVFSSFEARKDHGLLGQPIDYHVAALTRETWVPILELLLTAPSSPLYTDNNRNRIFYAESWLFVHQLLFKDRAAGYASLNRFFDARLHGADQLAAFQSAFVKDTTAADAELKRYFSRGGFGLTKLPFPPEAKVTSPFAPAPPQTVEIALARLAIGAGDIELARTHIDKALAIDPTTPAVHELLAMLESIRSNPEAASTAASTALNHGSKDAWMHILVAQNLWKQQSDRGTLDTAAREIADHYAKALELQPNLRNAYSNYAHIAQSLPSVTQADASLLTAGFKIYPDAADLLLGIAVVLHKGNNDAQATQLLGLALSRSSYLSQEDIAYAERLRSEWRIEPLARKIEELAKNKLYADALSECEKLLQEPMQMNQQRMWERRRNDLRFQVALDEIQLSENSGNLEEAIRQLEALIARTDLAQGHLSFARRQLERIRKRLPTAEAAP